jgi:excisionase family DNA binding protein
METLIVFNEAELKKCIQECIREVFREEISQLLEGVRQPWQAYEEPLLSREEMAEHLDISLPTLRKWVRQGLPRIRKGGRVLFLKSEVVKKLKEEQMKETKSKRKGVK